MVPRRKQTTVVETTRKQHAIRIEAERDLVSGSQDERMLQDNELDAVSGGMLLHGDFSTIVTN